ncbi:Zinc metalloproteinase nas-7 [Pseudolycoriella hygida]|uniref:Metalloendopeptidase n=1 Tax=Pseudolycoriella hygida TaxID=35572 RepID=A0A9Q0NA56_9DIPT|nr:Zinc metalloproteinase nas-7 [Pseudolycoriella hygida]
MNVVHVFLLICVHCVVIGTGKLIHSPLLKEPFEYEDENYDIIEGDILVKKGLGRNAMTDPAKHWPDRTIPYEINGTYNEDEMGWLMKGINSYNERTCIRIIPKTEEHENWIVIGNDKPGCFAYLGFRNQGPQVVNLGHGCLWNEATPVHELLHACGIDHEHNRADRDEYVKILWENIQEDQKHNFKKVDPNLYSDYGIEYNYDSVMHYWDTAFSKDPSLKSFETLKPYDGPFGDAIGWADSDIEKLHRMYECTSRFG